MYALTRNERRRSINIWPGFVDALATLLLVVIFVLMVFMIAQYFLSVALSGKDEALARLNQEISSLADLLALERVANDDLRSEVTQLSSELQSSLAERESLSSQLQVLAESKDDLERQLDDSRRARESLASQLAGMMAERGDLETRLRSSLEERDSLAARLAALSAERDQLAEDLSSASQARDSLASRLAALAERNEDSEKRLAEALASLRASQDSLAGQTDRMAALEALRDELRRDLEASQAARQALEEQYRSIAADKEKIEARLAEVAALQELRDRLQRDLVASRADAAAAREELEKAFGTIEADKEKIEAQLAEIAALQALRDQLRRDLTASETSVAAAKQELEEAYGTIEADKEKIQTQLFELSVLKGLRDELSQQLREMEAALATARGESEEERRQREALAARLSDSRGELQEQVKLNEEAQLKVDLLNRQIASLRRQLARLSVVLEASDSVNREQEVQIADLGKRLNLALATKVQELARYRSEFFGRLREVLGSREDIRIVGDRFVFQSELLFETASAELGFEGRRQIARLAGTLKELADQIPAGINWILQVEGHTDTRPIYTSEFRSNWELSTARALSVVSFLTEQGIPPTRLAATGYGEFQPIDSSESEEAFQKNRRIELKFTQK